MFVHLSHLTNEIWFNFWKQVWIDLLQPNLPKDVLVSCSIESALHAMKNASHSICVLTDRYATAGPLQNSTDWFDRLKKSYGDILIKHAPDYGSAFIGTWQLFKILRF